MSQNTHHVTPSPNGGWAVKKAGSTRASIRTNTKSDAVRLGRVISQRAGTQLTIHGSDGKVQKNLSIKAGK